MISLVGYTGFVGSNLSNSFCFDGLYNSKNIEKAFFTSPDILYYSGVPARKFIANKFGQEDMEIIKNAIENIKKIAPKKVVLISTVDVYKNPNGKDENAEMETDGLLPYGLNRLQLERYVKQNFEDYLIVRLPGLYGKNLKKNFIYDFLSFVPAMLTEEKIKELSQKDSEILKIYQNDNNGFYKLKDDTDKQKAKQLFTNIGFSALNFTDSRAVFQLYNLEFLYKDIQNVIDKSLKILNIATEPVSAGEIYKELTGEEFVNEITENPAYYDFRTAHSKLFGGQNGYIQSKDFVLRDIKNFVKNSKLNY